MILNDAEYLKKFLLMIVKSDSSKPEYLALLNEITEKIPAEIIYNCQDRQIILELLIICPQQNFTDSNTRSIDILLEKLMNSFGQKANATKMLYISYIINKLQILTNMDDSEIYYDTLSLLNNHKLYISNPAESYPALLSYLFKLVNTFDRTSPKVFIMALSILTKVIVQYLKDHQIIMVNSLKKMDKITEEHTGSKHNTKDILDHLIAFSSLISKNLINSKIKKSMIKALIEYYITMIDECLVFCSINSALINVFLHVIYNSIFYSFSHFRNFPQSAYINKLWRANKSQLITRHLENIFYEKLVQLFNNNVTQSNIQTINYIIKLNIKNRSCQVNYKELLCNMFNCIKVDFNDKNTEIANFIESYKPKTFKIKAKHVNILQKSIAMKILKVSKFHENIRNNEEETYNIVKYIVHKCEIEYIYNYLEFCIQIYELQLYIQQIDGYFVLEDFENPIKVFDSQQDLLETFITSLYLLSIVSYRNKLKNDKMFQTRMIQLFDCLNQFDFNLFLKACSINDFNDRIKNSYNTVKYIFQATVLRYYNIKTKSKRIFITSFLNQIGDINEINDVEAFVLYSWQQNNRTNKMNKKYNFLKLPHKEILSTLKDNLLLDSSLMMKPHLKGYIRSIFSQIIYDKKMNSVNFVNCLFIYMIKTIDKQCLKDADKVAHFVFTFKLLINYYNENLEVYDKLCDLYMKTKNCYLYPPNAFRRIIITLLYIRCASQETFVLIKASKKLLLNKPLLVEDSEMVLSPNDPDNVDIPDSYTSLFLEIQNNAINVIHDLLDYTISRNAFLNNYFNAREKSKSERDALNELSRMLNFTPGAVTQFIDVLQLYKCKIEDRRELKHLDYNYTSISVVNNVLFILRDLSSENTDIMKVNFRLLELLSPLCLILCITIRELDEIISAKILLNTAFILKSCNILFDQNTIFILLGFLDKIEPKSNITKNSFLQVKKIIQELKDDKSK